MSTTTPTKLVLKYLKTIEEGGDITAFLPDAFTFDGPMLKADSKAAFLKGMAAIGEMRPRFEVLKTFTAGDDVCVLYNFLVGEKAIFMSEWSTVQDGQIASQRLVFDTKQFESAMAG